MKYSCATMCPKCKGGNCAFKNVCTYQNQEFDTEYEMIVAHKCLKGHLHKELDDKVNKDVSKTTTESTAEGLPGKDYYGGTACMDAIRKYLGEDGTKAWLKGNILKYLYRYNGKDGTKDLAKALDYLNYLMNME